MTRSDGRRLRALTIWVVALCTLGVAASSVAQTTDGDQPNVRMFIDPATAERVGPALRADRGPEDVPADGGGRVVYDLVTDGLRVASYDTAADRAPAQTDVPFAEAVIDDAPADRRFVIFDSAELIRDLSEQSRAALLRDFEAGNLIIGAEGFGRDLKNALDLISPDLYAAGTTTGGDGLWVLLQRSRDGHLNELTLGAPQDEEAMREAFRFAWDWSDRDAAPVAPTVTGATKAADASTATDAEDPWTAIHNFESKGTVYATFEGTPNEHAGTYTLLVSVYFLDDAEDQDTDYYLLEFGTVVGISEYEMTGDDFGYTSGKCGWWTSTQQVAVTVTTTGGQWWPNGYMPSTTVGSTSQTFTIGADISTSGPSANASYSQSYGTSDVTIDVYSNSDAEWLMWQASLVGCHDYGDYPDYSGASAAARTTYDLNPSFIAAVPEGSQLTFTATADGGDDQWGFTVQKDKIDCAFACIPPPEVKSYFGTYTNPISATCDNTGCT